MKPKIHMVGDVSGWSAYTKCGRYITDRWITASDTELKYTSYWRSVTCKNCLKKKRGYKK